MGPSSQGRADIAFRCGGACRAHGQLCVSVSAGDRDRDRDWDQDWERDRERGRARERERRRGRSRDMESRDRWPSVRSPRSSTCPRDPPTRLPANRATFVHAASPFPGFHQRDLALPLAERAKEREHRRRDSLLDLDARSEVRPGFLSFWEGRLHSVLEVPFFLGRLSCLPPGSPPGLGREPRGGQWPQ